MEDAVDKFALNPKKALFMLALPIVVGTVVQTLYNIVDTAFVGRLGASALAAITFSFPLFFILIAINSGINLGMTSRISRFLGEKNKKEAENAAMHGLFVSIASAAVIVILGFSFLTPTFRLLGAEGEVLILAVDYMTIVLYGVIFMFTSFVFQGIFAAQGNTKTPMKIQVTALILNAFLDPIFIFILGLGIKGAALATSLSFFVSLILFMVAVHKKSYLHIHIRNFHFSIPILKDIFSVGMPASFMIFLLSIYVMFLNRVMVYFSTNHVAAFGIATRLESVAIMPVVGFSMGAITLVGMFYGARKYHLVREVSMLAIKISLIITAAVGIVLFIFPGAFLRIFTPDKLLIDIGTPYLRLDVFTFPLIAVGMIISRVMQGLGFGLPGLIINLIRIFIVAIPLAYIFVFILDYGYLSVAAAMILGGVASVVVGMLWLYRKLEHIENKQSVKD